MATRGGVDRAHAPSRAPKAVFWALHGATVAVCAGLVLSDRFDLVDPTRAALLLACAGLYLVRHGVTLFHLLQRRVDWGEALGLAAFIATFEIGLLLVGGGVFRTAPIPLDGLDALAGALVLGGSLLNTGSELQRKRWKADPAHRGRCYTGGLFRWAMHINYFGDVVLFTGWALLTRSPWTLLLPAFMLGMFALVHIPPLDAYLSERYGAEFDAYARRTQKLIPFIW